MMGEEAYPTNFNNLENHNIAANKSLSGLIASLSQALRAQFGNETGQYHPA